MQQRYDIREEEDGMWTVYDVFTGLPAEVNGEILIGLDIQEADDAVDLMNLIDLKRRGEID